VTAPSRSAAAAALAATTRAVAEARLAYEFVPNSYTYSCLSACRAAEHAVVALQAALLEQHTVGEGT
jgi:hypothetical protein